MAVVVMENQQQPLAVVVDPTAPPPLPPPPPPPPPLPPPPHTSYKHRCKVCKKGFTCGRALGGHMRAHGVTDDVLSAPDDDDSDGDGGGGGGGAWDSSDGTTAAAAAAAPKRTYSLRANAGRHKNCRVCENCGNEFTSCRSLLDHGRCSYYNREKKDDGGAGDDIDGREDEEEEEEDLAVAAGGWSKGKRTRRTKVVVVENDNSQGDEPVPVPVPATSREEEDLANCLVMLASSSRGGGVQPRQAIVDGVHKHTHASSAASTKQDENEKPSTSRKQDEKPRFLVPQPQPISMLPPAVPRFKLLPPPQVVMPPPTTTSPAVARGLFECNSCKKVFTSHQALGGHRASHKKVKGCFAAKLEQSQSQSQSSRNNNDSPQPSAASSSINDSSNNNVKVVVEAIPAAVVDGGNAEANNNMMNNARTTSAPEMANVMQEQVDEAPSSSAAVNSPALKKKGKVHECSICHRVFTSGQALGGHKRCHWLTTGAAGDPSSMAAAAVSKLPFVTQDHVVMHAVCQQLTLGPAPMYGTADSCLDLNVPTMMNQPAAANPAPAAGGINESMLSLNAPASLYMHSWAAGQSNASNNMHNNTATSGHYDLQPEATAGTEDEADSTSAKRARISDLKDMNMAGETSPWLQVGIALPSETNERLLEPKG